MPKKRLGDLQGSTGGPDLSDEEVSKKVTELQESGSDYDARIHKPGYSVDSKGSTWYRDRDGQWRKVTRMN